MIYQTPDGLQRRGPQHASPFSAAAAPLRGHGVRALRLLVTAGAWGAGLCLTIGLVALVSGADATPGRPPHARTAASTGQVSPLADSKTTVPPYTRQTFSGTGDGGGFFRIAAHSRWHLRWAYHCMSTQTPTYLTISEPYSSAGVSIDAAGVAGHGGTWTYSDAPAHFLNVSSDCAWTVTVDYHR
jgi:hypothetical protein